jgi:NADP-dependent 3-hydroxy acid dehydrogenase YdfG
MLTDQVVIITGASSGIGQATALALAAQGARLALAARRPQALAEVAAQAQALGAETLVAPTDVTQREPVQALVQQTLERWGQIDVLVCNAGQYLRAPIAQLDPALLEQSLAVNFYGSVYPILAVLPHMLARRRGQLVLITSLDAKKGLPPDAPYVAAKFALSGFGDVLRQELHGTGVHSTLIFPGRVDTPMLTELHVPAISPKIPPQAIARAVLHAIRRHPAEIIVPPGQGLLYAIHLLSPHLADWAVRAFRLGGWS